jgi:hypothetical protein
MKDQTKIIFSKNEGINEYAFCIIFKHSVIETHDVGMLLSKLIPQPAVRLTTEMIAAIESSPCTLVSVTLSDSNCIEERIALLKSEGYDITEITLDTEEISAERLFAEVRGRFRSLMRV